MPNDTLSYARRMAESMIPTLVGGIVTGVFITPEDSDGAILEGYGFTIQSADGITRNVFVLTDEEANGPGFLDIQINQALSAEPVVKKTVKPGQPGNWHCNCPSDYIHHTGELSCNICALKKPDTGVKVDSLVIETTSEYWDCECKRDYIHPRKEPFCKHCNFKRQDAAESRIEEVLAAGFKIT